MSQTSLLPNRSDPHETAGKRGIRFSLFEQDVMHQPLPIETPNLDLWMWTPTCTATTAVTNDASPRAQEDSQQWVHKLPQYCSGSSEMHIPKPQPCALFDGNVGFSFGL